MHGPGLSVSHQKRLSIHYKNIIHIFSSNDFQQAVYREMMTPEWCFYKRAMGQLVLTLFINSGIWGGTVNLIIGKILLLKKLMNLFCLVEVTPAINK